MSQQQRQAIVLTGRGLNDLNFALLMTVVSFCLGGFPVIFSLLGVVFALAVSLGKGDDEEEEGDWLEEKGGKRGGSQNNW